MKQFILLISSPDKKGLVYKITEILYRRELNIIKNDEFVDGENSKFFMRTVFEGEISKDELLNELEINIPAQSTISLIGEHKKSVVLLATKESHALGDILIRYDSGELNMNILGVISNYDTLRPLVEKFDIPYFHISHEGLEREAHEKEILGILQDLKAEVLVLAKYMRILSSDFVHRYQNRIINIHHSFLPAFIGANPYKQAFKRGVKIIGATAHFVNNNLDEGPIIAQDVKHIDHSYSWKDMQKVGKDVEKIVLSAALNLVLEDRVFVHGNKTVIF